MTDSKLKRILQPIVQEYGLGPVLSSLGKIAEARFDRAEQFTTLGGEIANGSKQRRPTGSAPEYVEKMNLPVEKVAAVSELARRYQQKLFLPTFRDISSFCQAYEIQVPASNSRANAIPKVFKSLAELDPSEIQQILDDGWFSGPSRLGPIADGIRNYSSAVHQPPLE
jgi:hypothetical protein